MLGIKFPVYPLRAFTKKVTEHNITYIETMYDTYILDNKNLRGSFAERRLQIKGKVYPLNKSISTFEELIKYKNNKLFVDSTGEVFKYKKSKKSTVKCYEILDAVELSSGGYLIYTKELKPLIYDSESYINFNYILVFWNNGYIIYGFSDEYIEEQVIRI